MVESRPLLLNTSLPLQSPTVQHKTVCDVRVILTAACAGVWSSGGHVARGTGDALSHYNYTDIRAALSSSALFSCCLYLD